MNQQHFNIRDYVTFNEKGRAVCPACQQVKGSNYRKLNLWASEDGGYHCHRGCTTEEIRTAVGAEKQRVIPSALVATKPAANVTISPQQKMEAHNRLLESNGQAKHWLYQRGITDDIIRWFHLGIVRAKVGKQPFRHVPAIIIPIPANRDETSYYQKKRLLPWLSEAELQQELGDLFNEYKPWSQYGIPAMVWLTHNPANATSTWLCEGEWDAMLLGWHCFKQDLPIAVATFTSGCQTIPPAHELEKLPGQVYVFYDRQDEPLKNGDRPGEVGAKKVCQALGDRSRLALVPMPDDCNVKGWDVSNALLHGFTLADFVGAAHEAMEVKFEQEDKRNPLRSRLIWNDDLIDRAPDFTEWLVQDILTVDELFLLAAGPRAGKSLLAMTLAKAVAEGGEFLGRPVTQGTVIYVCLEDGDAKLKERETAQGWSRGLPVAWLQKFKLSELPHLRQLAEELDPRLIILDTLSRIKDATISESSAEMSQTLEPLQEMAKDLGCCVLLVHHTGKVSVDNASNVEVFDTIRGSSAIRAVCRGTLIIAATERNYRLCVENGWGKHDLSIVLDANTWTWKLLGKWNPNANFNASQRDQVIECLKQLGQATIEQIHDVTHIPKKSLYETLSRLQSSDTAEEKVIKEGSRRRYTYRLALFNTIQQLNSVLNSDNPDRESDTGYIQQKNTFSYRGDQPKPDQIGTCDTLITPPQGVINGANVDPEGDSTFCITRTTESRNADVEPVSENDQVLAFSPPTSTEFVEYHPSNPDGVRVSPIQHAIQQGFVEMADNPDTAGDSRYSTAIQQPIQQPPSPVINVGDKVEILRKGQFYHKRAIVQSVSDDGIQVKGSRWLVTHTYAATELRRIAKEGK